MTTTVAHAVATTAPSRIETAIEPSSDTPDYNTRVRLEKVAS